MTASAVEGRFSRLLREFLWRLLHTLSIVLTLRPRLLWSQRQPLCTRAPAHVALAGDVSSSPASLARIVLAAQEAGARIFSICSTDEDIIRKACVAAGVVIPVVVRPPAPRSLIVQAARELSTISLQDRNCDVNDPSSVLKYLDGIHEERALPTEPDVLVFLPKQGEEAEEFRSRVFASFSVWQLRLTQMRFADQPLMDMTDDQFLHLVCSATLVEKRFGR